LLNQPGKAVKTFPHVCRSRAEEHAHGGGELRDHQSAPRPWSPSRPAAWMATRSSTGLTLPVSRTTQALASSISSWPLGSALGNETGRKVGAGAPWTPAAMAAGRSEVSGEAGGASRNRRFQA